MRAKKRQYHHGNLAESLLNAVDEIASQFGLEAVSLRACAKRVGVSPSSAFRHYADKRALMTAFATRALTQLAEALEHAGQSAMATKEDSFEAVCIAYVRFAVEKPAYFRAMWREEAIYTSDRHYSDATQKLWRHLKGGFAATLDDDDPDELSATELLAWSAVHGLANLFVDGPLGKDMAADACADRARELVNVLRPKLEGVS